MRVQLSCYTGILAALISFCAIAQDSPLTGCASETPPFVLMNNGRGESGFSVELFKLVATKLQRKADIQELPWARCLDEVKSGRIDLAIDAYDDADRRKLFFYSRAYYTLTPQVFFVPGRKNLVWPVTTVADLKQRSGCGIHEYTYEHYNLEAETLDRGATNDKLMLTKLAAARCDYAIEELEYIIGARAAAADWPDEKNIRSFRPTWARGPQLHYVLGKSRVDGTQLQQQVNTAIVALEKSGEIRRLAKRYFQTAKAQ